MRILQRFIFGEVCYVGSLDNRIRELITITVLTVNQTLPQLKAHVGACLNVGLSPLEIRETIYQCAPFIGFPKTLNAITAMNEVFTSKNIPLPLQNAETVTEETRYEKCLEIEKNGCGHDIAARYSWLPGDFSENIAKWTTELFYSDFFMRKGLDSKTRKLLAVVIIAATGITDAMMKYIVLSALKAGNTSEEIVCALVHASPYMGMPLLFNALNYCKENLK